ncbi:hypothetical protein A0H81_12786 [Grifola frondosa]|uniref:glutathione transferase n=1 Tax=Grifola frondosa TaxID=5627 RepID=A0A1C7LSS4_GRIFR|nr:hypothetical protein A0H81_12786 [Grifola frondosa]
MAIKLYGFPASTCTRRVAVVLKEKNVPYEFVGVDRTSSEHKSENYLAKQPFGQVPYIVDEDGFTLFESRAIGRYIATKYAAQGEKLIPDPSDLKATALFEQAASIEAFNFDPSQLMQRDAAADVKLLESYKTALNAKLDAYEVILSKTKYLAGDSVTLADLFHLPFGARLEEYGVNVLTSEKRPNVARRRSLWPSHHPDAPPVLIPRPETEDWAIRLSELITPSPEKPISLLDLCTGTGCIPLLLCHVWSPGSVRATGVDILPSALKLARDNAVLNGVAVSEVGPLSQAFDSWKQNTFATYQADILSKDFARLSALEPPYDVITSNPPYIPRKDYDALDPSVKDWEDSRALLGDPDPLAPEAVSEGHRGLSFYHTIATF